MLKKIFVISITAFVLVGCNTKVTQDMLVGKWGCHQLRIQKTYYENGSLKETLERQLPRPFIITYTKDNNGLMTRQFEDLKPEEFQFVQFSQSEYRNVDFETEYNITKEYIFFSNNKFEIVEDRPFRNRLSKRIIETNHDSVLCIRAKN